MSFQDESYLHCRTHFSDFFTCKNFISVYPHKKTCFSGASTAIEFFHIMNLHRAAMNFFDGGGCEWVQTETWPRSHINSQNSSTPPLYWYIVEYSLQNHVVFSYASLKFLKDFLFIPVILNYPMFGCTIIVNHPHIEWISMIYAANKPVSN